jgi:arsenate reductase
MAEGLMRALSGGTVDVHSAGTQPSRVNPLAIEVMKEVGIDISSHRSKSVEEFVGQRFDAVVTVCDNAKESCPIFPGAPQRIHWSYPDPAAVRGSEDEKLRAFRTIRDDLRRRLQSFLASHGGT